MNFSEVGRRIRRPTFQSSLAIHHHQSWKNQMLPMCYHQTATCDCSSINHCSTTRTQRVWPIPAAMCDWQATVGQIWKKQKLKTNWT